MAEEVPSAPVQEPIPAAPPPPPSPQLTQVRAPLDEASEALSTPDASGRLPIVLLPKQTARVRNDFVALGILALIAGVLFDIPIPVRGGAGAVGVALIVLGVFRSFLVRVPEGAQAVLLQRGRFLRTIPAGNHVVAPWIIVSHVVTIRETTFDAPATEVPTRDDVRTNVDILITFRIAHPEQFVFTISAGDFDEVCQATCQEAVRLAVRETGSEEILDLAATDAERLRVAIDAALEPYGIEVVRVVVTHVTPPAAFMASREARRLATVRRAEEEEHHALALLRQHDLEELEQQRITAHRQAIELEAANEVVRLERLQARLGNFPGAMHWDVETQRLEVARALAANPRAMVQVGPSSDVAAALLMATVTDDANGAPRTNTGPTATERMSASDTPA